MRGSEVVFIFNRKLPIPFSLFVAMRSLLADHQNISSFPLVPNVHLNKNEYVLGITLVFGADRRGSCLKETGHICLSWKMERKELRLLS